MMRFKTNAKCGGCVAAIRTQLQGKVDDNGWSLDLASADKVLTVTADMPADTIMEAVKAAGFKIEQLG